MIYRCMYRTSPKCLKFKSDQPYGNAMQRNWVCPMCADLTYRKFRAIAETEPLKPKRRLLEGFQRVFQSKRAV